MNRGRVRVYLGAAPGVGTTCEMLREGRRLADADSDVVVGFLETHGRAGTAAVGAGLEMIPRPLLADGGGPCDVMDVQAVLARNPDVVLVDDLARTADGGMGGIRRHRDLDVLLEAGIDVLTTLEVRQLDSVGDIGEAITGTRLPHTVPDHVVRAADQIQLVDLPPEQLRARLADGLLYPPDQVDAALSTLFRTGNLAALREITLLWLADRVDEYLANYRAEHGITDPWEVRERVLVGLAGTRADDSVLRRAARLARRGRGTLLGVHVQVTRDHAEGMLALEDRRSVLESMGGTFREVVADTVATGLLTVARAEGATQIVLGTSRRPRWREALGPSVLHEVLRGSGPDLDVHVISQQDDDVAATLPRAPRLSVLGARRRIAGFALTIVGLTAITALFAPEAGVLGLGASSAPQVAPDALTTPLLLYLTLTVGVAAVGGMWPGLTCAIASVLLGNAVFTRPRGSLTVHSADDVVALVVFLLISILVSTLTDLVARRAAQTARARAEVRVLTRLAATIPAVADPLARLTEEIRDLFDLDGVALVRRTEDDRWVVECATGDAPDRPAEADDHLRVDAQRFLLLRGPRAPAEDRRLLAAVVTQLAVASTRRSLTEATAALQQANAANELRTALLSAVSHDLRTPLASIKAAASSMLADDVELSPDLVSQFAEAIVADSDRLNRLVTNLLDMSRLQAGATQPLMEPVGIDEVVALALDQTPARLVELRIPGRLPDVWADPALLERVLANLIDNAIKASHGPPVVIWVARIPEGIMVSIIDYGHGIPADAVDAVFRPFQRLGDAPRGRGVGLGLAIAKGFTDAMGGELRVEPTPGGGTTMRLTLPLATSQPAGRSTSPIDVHG